MPLPVPVSCCRCRCWCLFVFETGAGAYLNGASAGAGACLILKLFLNGYIFLFKLMGAASDFFLGRFFVIWVNVTGRYYYVHWHCFFIDDENLIF